MRKTHFRQFVCLFFSSRHFFSLYFFAHTPTFSFQHVNWKTKYRQSRATSRIRASERDTRLTVDKTTPETRVTVLCHRLLNTVSYALMKQLFKHWLGEPNFMNNTISIRAFPILFFEIKVPAHLEKKIWNPFIRDIVTVAWLSFRLTQGRSSHRIASTTSSPLSLIYMDCSLSVTTTSQSESDTRRITLYTETALLQTCSAYTKFFNWNCNNHLVVNAN